MRHIYGVDFSGAADAGRKIWLAGGSVAGDTLHVTECVRGADLPGAAIDRDRALAALRDFIAGAGAAVFGLDFPLSMPAELLAGQSWRRFIRSLAARYPTAQAFRRQCRRAARGRELKRATEIDSRAPFAAYNLRLYQQTYYGLRDLIGPLIAGRQASVLPLQRAAADRPWLIEICPAATLKQMQLYAPYKGRGAAARAQREVILKAVQSIGPVRLTPRLRSVMLDDPGGDALDSLIAALAAFQAWRDFDLARASFGRLARLEGYIFV